MGTSTDRRAGSGGAWTPLKHAAASYMRSLANGSPRTDVYAQRVVARHVPVLGGAAAAAATAHAGRAGIQRLGTLLAGVAQTGLEGALAAVGLVSLVGRDRFDVLDELITYISGNGDDLESQAARDAACDVLADIFGDADSWPELTETSSANVSREELARLLELFLVQYVYNRVPVVAERLVGLADHQAVTRADEEMLQIIQTMVVLRLPDDPFAVDWAGSEGRQIAEDTVRLTYEALEGFGDDGIMTNYLVRTDLTAPVDGPERLPEAVGLLDWAPGDPGATIQVSEAETEFFHGWYPPRPAADLLLLGAAVYCADKTTPRRMTPDSWTRTLTVALPVAQEAAWRESRFADALDFLTGDRWTIQPHTSDVHPFASLADPPVGDRFTGAEVDGVCLFSGGLDSLCGVIDLLDEDPGRRLCLMSHHEGGQASTAQRLLLAELVTHYGPNRITSRRLFLRPAPPNNRQARPLPRTRENTTRSRSLLFMSSALAIAAANGPSVPVYVPENGFIGINVPLTRARVGSASTRTTHPHFMHQLGSAASAVGIPNPVINPYRLRTKGEILAESRNVDLLRRLAPSTVRALIPRPRATWAACRATADTASLA